MKSIGKATWARSLLEKAGLRRRQEGDEDFAVGKASELQNTTEEARRVAAKGVDSPTETLDVQRAGSLKLVESNEPFLLENIKTLSYLCGTFLFRWGNDGWKQRSYSTRLLNTLAFYHVEVAGSGASVKNVSLVHMLWCVLQDIERFDDFIKVRSVCVDTATPAKV